MLNKLAPFWRHLLIGLAAALLTWASTDLIPNLQGKGGIAAIAGTLVTMLVLYITPLVNQYGVGSGSSSE